MNEISIINLFLEAGMVVKIVMIILLVASLLTWIVIVERYNFFKKIKKINTSFHAKFWAHWCCWIYRATSPIPVTSFYQVC